MFHQYTLRVANRDAVASGLRERGIPSMVYYPVPLHEMPPYASGGRFSLAETERACRDVLSLPMHPHLSMSDLARVAEAVRELVTQPVPA